MKYFDLLNSLIGYNKDTSSEPTVLYVKDDKTVVFKSKTGKYSAYQKGEKINPVIQISDVSKVYCSPKRVNMKSTTNVGVTCDYELLDGTTKLQSTVSVPITIKNASKQYTLNNGVTINCDFNITQNYTNNRIEISEENGYLKFNVTKLGYSLLKLLEADDLYVTIKYNSCKKVTRSRNAAMHGCYNKATHKYLSNMPKKNLKKWIATGVTSDAKLPMPSWCVKLSADNLSGQFSINDITSKAYLGRTYNALYNVYKKLGSATIADVEYCLVFYTTKGDGRFYESISPLITINNIFSTKVVTFESR